MKKITFFAVMLMAAITGTYAQTADKATTLKEVLTLKIDRSGGANGAAVAWHPGQKKYYAAQAGNATFPMEVFDEKGKMLSDDQLETKKDVRGMWYNPTSKTLQITTYNTEGWWEYKLDSKGMPVSVSKLPGEASQPDPQSAGVYDPKKATVYFYDMENVWLEAHSIKNGEKTGTTIQLYPGARSKDEAKMQTDDAKYNYSENTVIYTGIPHGEIGLLNTRDKQIELYDIATGLMTSELKLPSDAPVHPSLNFSYCNNIFWLFDTGERVWHGYKITKNN